MNKKKTVCLIISIIIICIGIIIISCSKRQNKNVINQIENNNQLNQDSKKEIDLSNNNSKTKDYGIITNIENNIITIKNEDSCQIKIDENTIRIYLEMNGKKNVLKT